MLSRSFMRAITFRLPVVMPVRSRKRSIVNGLGISILSSRSVNDLQRTKQILVFPLEEAAHKRSFYIVYSKNRILKPHVKQFVQFVRDYYM